jgi:hypothetical protein
MWLLHVSSTSISIIVSELLWHSSMGHWGRAEEREWKMDEYTLFFFALSRVSFQGNRGEKRRQVCFRPVRKVASPYYSLSLCYLVVFSHRYSALLFFAGTWLFRHFSVRMISHGFTEHTDRT